MSGHHSGIISACVRRLRMPSAATCLQNWQKRSSWGKSGRRHPDANLRPPAGDPEGPRAPRCAVQHQTQLHSAAPCEIEGAAFEDVTYEGYGRSASAVLVRFVYRNRTVPSPTSALFTRNGGRLGASGSVAYRFRCGHRSPFQSLHGRRYPAGIVLDAGAAAVRTTIERCSGRSQPEDFGTVRQAIEEAKVTISQRRIYDGTHRPRPLDSKTPLIAPLMERLEEDDERAECLTQTSDYREGEGSRHR